MRRRVLVKVWAYLVEVWEAPGVAPTQPAVLWQHSCFCAYAMVIVDATSQLEVRKWCMPVLPTCVGRYLSTVRHCLCSTYSLSSQELTHI